MDSYEATKVVFSRIQALDPEHASKITGYVLIQEHGEKEMIRLAFGPESLLVSLIQRAKADLGISSTMSASSSSSSVFNTKSSSIQSPRLGNPTHSNFARIPTLSAWNFPPLSPNSSSASPSYAAVVNGATNSSTLSSSTSPTDLLEDLKFPDNLSFLNETSDAKIGSYSTSWNDSVNPNNHNLHRRSFSLSDACLGCDDSSGWKPCLFYARGFCKNGSSCKFLHGGFVDSLDSPTAVIGSPGKIDPFEPCHELLRSKSVLQQQHRFPATSHLMSGASFPYSPRSAAAIAMADEFQKFGKRSDFSSVALNGCVNPGSRQIYLTFPADSTFREEDVSNYFSIFGPVQDVRIPYQQKRMFGFVTFVYPETVKLILAKGNPHFVCDSRVLVKPYKEKGKLPEKKQQLYGMHSLERMDYSCSSPTAFDDLGGRMYYNSQELIFRRNMEEQVELQKAIELQGRRLMNLQLLDLKNLNNRYAQNLSPRMHMRSPTQSPNSLNQMLIHRSDYIKHESVQDNVTKLQREELVPSAWNNLEKVSNTPSINSADLDTESLEHILPDSLFASPKKSACEKSIFSTNEENFESNNNTSLPTPSMIGISAMAPCSFQLPRLATGHGAIEM